MIEQQTNLRPRNKIKEMVNWGFLGGVCGFRDTTLARVKYNHKMRMLPSNSKIKIIKKRESVRDVVWLALFLVRYRVLERARYKA